MVKGRLPPNASVAGDAGGGKLCAPSAVKNGPALTALLREHAPQAGRALELASGTGHHVQMFARARPGLTWQPTEIAPARRASIDAYTAEGGLPNVLPAVALDAAAPGWHKDFAAQDLVTLCNLLHLIPAEAAERIIHEAVAALKPGGRFMLYGPFRRGGALTSEGDARFDAQLRAADPAIGYKDDAAAEAWLRAAGTAEVARVEMPANNLAFIATR